MLSSTLSSFLSPTSSPSPSSFSPSTLASVVEPAVPSGNFTDLLFSTAATVVMSAVESNATNGSFAAPQACFGCMPITLRILFTMIAATIVVCGVLGNVFVVGVIVTDRKLLNSSVNLFLLNLALADMSNLIFCAPDGFQLILALGWTLPGFACPIVRFLQEYSLYASVLLQMSIGIERFMAICSPLKAQRLSKKTTSYFLIFAWGMAAVFAFPFLYYSTIRESRVPGQYACYPRNMTPEFRKTLDGVNFVVLYGVPLVLLATLYSIMCKRLWGNDDSLISNEAQQVAILRLRRSVVKMLIISILLYFICYTPIQAFGITGYIIEHWSPPTVVRVMVNLLPLVSSAASPIVYIICCRHFHMRFVQMFGWIINCCSPTPEKYQTVITDTEKYARMSVTLVSENRRHRRVRRSPDDLALTVCLIPQVHAKGEQQQAFRHSSLGDYRSHQPPRNFREHPHRVSLRPHDIK